MIIDEKITPLKLYVELIKSLVIKKFKIILNNQLEKFDNHLFISGCCLVI